MSICYHYFDISPRENLNPLSIERALDIIKNRYSNCIINGKAALESARIRHRALALSKAPPEIIAIYENPKVTRLSIPVDGAPNYWLEFDLWDRQGITVYPKPNENKFLECEQEAKKLAELLSYEMKVEEYD